MLYVELFPNEILHSIFSYLNSDEIIYSFLDLNIRFFIYTNNIYPFLNNIYRN